MGIVSAVLGLPRERGCIFLSYMKRSCGGDSKAYGQRDIHPWYAWWTRLSQNPCAQRWRKTDNAAGDGADFLADLFSGTVQCQWWWTKLTTTCPARKYLTICFASGMTNPTPDQDLARLLCRAHTITSCTSNKYVVRADLFLGWGNPLQASYSA